MKNILVLEDEAPVMKLLRHMLKGHTVIEAVTAEQAVYQFRNHGHIDLVIADVTLPSSSGVQAALRIRSEYAELPVILTSGYPVGGWSEQDSRDLERLGSRAVRVLRKPFRAQLLQETLRELTGEPETKTGTE